MLNPDTARVDFSGWLFQQRDAYLAFFALRDDRPVSALNPHITHVETIGSSYAGCGVPSYEYFNPRSGRTSWVNTITWRSADGKEHTRIIPWPEKETGFFIINGFRYFVPFIRLSGPAAPPQGQYLRIDHLIERLSSAQYRRHQKKQSPVSVPSEGDETNLDEETLRSPGIMGVLWNTIFSSGSSFRRQVPCNANVWDRLCSHTIVEVRGVRKNGHGGKCTCVPDIRDSDFSMAVRKSTSGLDCFHTPENKLCGLTRHLAVGTFVTDAMALSVDLTSAASNLGLVSRCIPYLRHNDPRRVLMACKMMCQAVQVEHPEPPAIRTDFNDYLRKQFPGENFDLGTNLLSGFMFWDGLTFEDAVVISESAANRLVVIETWEHEILLPPNQSVDTQMTSTTFDCGYRRKGGTEKQGRDLVSIGTKLGCTTPDGLEWAGILRDSACRRWQLPEGECFKVAGEPFINDFVEGNQPPGAYWRARVVFKLSRERPLRVGDKVCNRHGNKGVIAKIENNDKMPTVDGRRLDILFNPLSTFSRGNYGQLYEAIATGCGARPLEEHLNDLGVAKSLDGLHECVVRLPSSHPISQVKAVVGYNYILRLPEYADGKRKETGDCTGKFSRITGQPVAGVAQKYGEMEIRALQAHGADAILAELCGTRSRNEKQDESTSARRTTVPTCQQAGVLERLKCLGVTLKRERMPHHMVALRLEATSRKPGVSILDPEVTAPMPARQNESRVTHRDLGALLESTEFFVRHNNKVYFDLGPDRELDVSHAGVTPAPPVAAKNRQTFPRDFVFPGRWMRILPPAWRCSPHGTYSSELTAAYLELGKLLLKPCAARKSDHRQSVTKAIKHINTQILAGDNGKESFVRKLGLSRRLTYSARMVVVFDPLLPPDTVSIPWRSAKVLFDDVTEVKELVNLRRDDDYVHLLEGKAINSALHPHLCLINRPPSLHRGSVLAVRPQVHFDSDAMRISPLLTEATNVDCDGDEMTLVRLFDEGAVTQAHGLMLTSQSMLWTDASGTLLPTLSKDFLAGLHQQFLTHDHGLDAANRNLADKALPPFRSGPTASTTGENLGPEFRYNEWIAEYLRGHNLPQAKASVFFSCLLQFSVAGMRLIERHSAFGPPEKLQEVLDGYEASGASKRLPKHHRDLIQGIAIRKLDRMAHKLIGHIMKAKTQIGLFGDLPRTLFYTFSESEGNGTAAKGEMQDALRSLHVLAAKATQQVLDSKTNTPLGYVTFRKAFKNSLLGSSIATAKLASLLKMDIPVVEKHVAKVIQVSRRELLDAPGEPSLLWLLSDPLDALVAVSKGAELRASATDPRIALFLA